jgi:hypothetical protein
MKPMTEKPARWTQATVYADMWVDPDDDPRESDDGASPDGELETLQDYLANYRLTLLMKCEGLDAGQLARRSVPPSTMSLPLPGTRTSASASGRTGSPSGS